MRYIALILVTIGLLSCNEDEPQTGPVATAAIEKVSFTSDSVYAFTGESMGTATFTQLTDRVEVRFEFAGQSAGDAHAIHLHNGTCAEPAMHWNQGQEGKFCNTMDLGAIWARPFAGDIGNIVIDENGNGILSFETSLYTVGDGSEKDVIGKIIYIHQNEEDFAQECFQSHDHMHINPKIACGEITPSN